MMLQGTGSSIYVFIAVVAVFLIGIAGGSLIYERQRDRVPQMATLGALLAAAAGLALLPMIASNTSGPSYLPVAVVFILPVTTIFGYTFPLTVRLFVDSAEQSAERARLPGPLLRREVGVGDPQGHLAYQQPGQRVHRCGPADH
jgi:hypothetical protein